LVRSGIEPDRVFFVGNTMIDTLLANLDRLVPPAFWAEIGLRQGEYILLTLHRPSNVDDPRTLEALLRAVCAGARGLPVIFPIHPRTARTLEPLAARPAGLHVVEAQPYLEFIYLSKHAKAVVTDSGGITEETTVMGVPCMTLRKTTERPETVESGTNVLLGTEPAALAGAFDTLFANRWKRGKIPEKWDGRTGERIVAALERLYPE
jgi:UDP-N-acetylglucosamine 2-epimerase (non-hydrolysing)